MASLDLEIHQMDVVSAFLASKLKEKIYMELPEGFKDGDIVGLLDKSIYCLKQSARYFNRHFHNHLLHLCFVQTFVDPCVYISIDTSIIIAIWVDNILLFGASIIAIDTVKRSYTRSASLSRLPYGTSYRYGIMRRRFGLEIFKFHFTTSS